ncbi:MAG: hypothetical protein ABI723_01085 [Bacteroidia bacterium]
MILAECQADTLLAKLLLPGYDIDRSCNIGAVANRFEKFYKNRKAIGIIDYDKNMGRTFKQFKKYNENDLPNMKHLWNNQYHHLIYFKKGLEHFIDESATQAKLDRNKYPKFNSMQQIRIYTKSIDVDKNDEFKTFLFHIRDRKPANFETFTKWIMEINSLK